MPPSQPRKNPRSCHIASSPKQPGITGSSLKWLLKNQRSGLISNSARISPLPNRPPKSQIWLILSNISSGGSGSLAFPGPNSSPRAQARRAWKSNEAARTCLSNFARARSSLHPSLKPIAPPLLRNILNRLAACCPFHVGWGWIGLYARSWRQILRKLAGICGFGGRSLKSNWEKDLGPRAKNHTEKLRNAGLRPTRQRLALAQLLFGKGDRHVSAEALHEEAMVAGVPISLATVYNSMHQFTAAGLLREVTVDGSRVYFDTNTADHHQFDFEDDGTLLDIDWAAIEMAKLTSSPPRAPVDRVDVIVRLKRH